jgi:phosphoribosylamine--glycine ligase
MQVDDAIAAAKDILGDKSFGSAGSKIVVEEFLAGEEASFIVMVDGEHVLPMATSQDHKRALNEDLGPNTGGMGAYSPAPVVTPEIHARIMDEVIMPTVRGMANEGAPYSGFLYAGLMIAADGTPNVIEYNCRFGDPETQPIMMRLQSDLVELCLAATRGELDKVTIDFDNRPAVGVVLAAQGYPGTYPKGDVISGLTTNNNVSAKIFHAGTKFNELGEIVTNGGRVLCATALGNSVTEAQVLAYELLHQITWQGVEFRTDIAYRAMTREKQLKI